MGQRERRGENEDLFRISLQSGGSEEEEKESARGSVGERAFKKMGWCGDPIK